MFNTFITQHKNVGRTLNLPRLKRNPFAINYVIMPLLHFVVTFTKTCNVHFDEYVIHYVNETLINHMLNNTSLHFRNGSVCSNLVIAQLRSE